VDELQLIDEPGVANVAAAVPGEGDLAGPRVYVETYGCQMNVADTEVMLGILSGAGFRTVSRPEDADVMLLNTCAVREKAEERVVGRLTQLSRFKMLRPEVILGVCGCMAKHLAEALLDRVPTVDLVLGPDSYRRLPEMIRQASDEPALDVRLDREEGYADVDPLRIERSNAWISIMRGCDKFCTFCVVPYVRGRERSVSAEEVVRQAETAAGQGYKEVTLLGQTVNSYHDGDCDFADLLERVAAVPGIRRIRFTSPHPSDFSPKLIDTMAAEPKVCRYIHLPVQSGSNAVLSRMKRDYTVEAYLDLASRLRSAMPGLCLSTDVIVGFPGETEEDYRATVELMRQQRFDSAFMFKYSPREGTAAWRELPDSVPEPVKGERLIEVIALQTEISGEINAGYVGRRLEVLVAGDAPKGEGRVIGRSDGHKKVIFPRAGAADSALVPVLIESANSHTLMGRHVGRDNMGSQNRTAQHAA
jgi:tRNA-2-methylthio-N6-dimethylallyladenosine synthase